MNRSTPARVIFRKPAGTRVAMMQPSSRSRGRPVRIGVPGAHVFLVVLLEAVEAGDDFALGLDQLQEVARVQDRS
jgi:hypothetical protein